MLNYRLFEKTLEEEQQDIVDGDMVVVVGDIDNIKSHNHIGYYREQGGVEFLNRFDDKLHNMMGELRSNNGWFVKRQYLKPFVSNEKEKSLPVVFSERLKDVFSYSMKCLLDYENIYFTDFSFVDITDRNDTLSCLMWRDYVKLEDKTEVWDTKLRTNIRVGKFFKKMFPDDPDEFVQDFSNEYKFTFNLTKEQQSRIKIVSGSQVPHWYLGTNYSYGGGSLNSSCMKSPKSQERLQMYVENPDKVALMVVKDSGGKLMGRALLWKLDEPKGRKFMDRVYCTEDYIEKLFYDYSKRHGYIDRLSLDDRPQTLIVKLPKDYGPPQKNPFMDTFKFFVKDGNYLTNKFQNFKPGEFWEYIDHD